MKFTINASTGALAFKAAPDFEAPSDVGSDNTYKVNAGVGDGTNVTTQNITVMVTNVNEGIVINGTANDDNIPGTGADETFNGLAGNDTINAFGGNDTLNGNEGKDTLSGGQGNDTLNGNEGNDTFDGGVGADQMFGGVGDDIYFVDQLGDSVTELLGEGTDTIRSTINYTLAPNNNVENLTLLTGTAKSAKGNELNNSIVGNAIDNILIGNGGNDSLNGGAGADAMTGGTGNDIYVVDNAGDTVVENDGEGTDTVQTALSSGYTLGAFVENLTLTGNAAINGSGNNLNNVLIGNNSVNKLEGFGGNDTLDGREGVDNMIGGTGDDIYVVDNIGDITTEHDGEGTDAVQTALNNYALRGFVDNLFLLGTSGINGTGNDLSNLIVGNSGNNTLDGGGGADILNGGLGTDILNGGLDADILRGGAGNDTYLVDNVGDIVQENAGEGTTDLIKSSVSYTLSSEVERLTLTGPDNINATGNAADNILTGNNGNNVLDGGAGNDTMAGGVGDDTYRVDSKFDIVAENSNAGTDTIETTLDKWTLSGTFENLTQIGAVNFVGTGNGVANTIQGGAGNDTINGKAGNDILRGGAGSDLFVFDTSLNAATNVDKIVDFSVADDTIQLENLFFSKLPLPTAPALTGPLSADLFFVEGSRAQDANDYIVYNAAAGTLSYDSNGSDAGGRTLFATVAANLGLTSDDFVVS